MQYAKGSVEFRLLTLRYLKNLRYQLNVDAIRHHQESYLLLLLCKEHNSELIKQIVTSRDDNFMQSQAELEFGRAKIIYKPTPKINQSDIQKTEYLKILTDNQSFKSLGDILSRMKAVGNKE